MMFLCGFAVGAFVALMVRAIIDVIRSNESG